MKSVIKIQMLALMLLSVTVAASHLSATRPKILLPINQSISTPGDPCSGSCTTDGSGSCTVTCSGLCDGSCIATTTSTSLQGQIAECECKRPVSPPGLCVADSVNGECNNPTMTGACQLDSNDANYNGRALLSNGSCYCQYSVVNGKANPLYGQNCLGNNVCLFGQCVPCTGSGQYPAVNGATAQIKGSPAALYCVNTLNDPNNCIASGTQISSGTELSNYACPAADQYCKNGVCTCPTQDPTLCANQPNGNTSCVNTEMNAANCGGCTTSTSNNDCTSHDTTKWDFYGCNNSQCVFGNQVYGGLVVDSAPCQAGYTAYQIGSWLGSEAKPIDHILNLCLWNPANGEPSGNTDFAGAYMVDAQSNPIRINQFTQDYSCPAGSIASPLISGSMQWPYQIVNTGSPIWVSSSGVSTSAPKTARGAPVLLQVCSAVDTVGMNFGGFYQFQESPDGATSANTQCSSDNFNNPFTGNKSCPSNFSPYKVASYRGGGCVKTGFYPGNPVDLWVCLQKTTN